DDGTRYRLPVDDVLQLKLRQVTPESSIGARLAPRDIQAYIRSGMSAEDVATITGAPLDHIQRFEGPVLAEREFVVTSALSVPVHTALETDPLAQGVNFGMAIRSRLQDLGAASERWASWKDAATGWIVKLSFTADQIDHDARWHFDPKKQALDPINNEAVTLSQQGNATGSLIPRLRAVHQEERPQDASRFDSGAFDLGEADAPEARAQLEAATRNATKPMPEQGSELNQTADLLDALRRRRGEREAASYEDDSFDEAGSPFAPPQAGTQQGSIRLVDVPVESTDEPPLDSAPAARTTGSQPSVRQTGGQPRVRKGRQAMPSWDEIVFGARPDDDLA
ncbi:MAG TPA: septation protein SepH, partial [Galbitalea sp.]